MLWDLLYVMWMVACGASIGYGAAIGGWAIAFVGLVGCGIATVTYLDASLHRIQS
jgi:hypothetical protein